MVTLPHQLDIDKFRFVFRIFKNPPRFLIKNLSFYKLNSCFLNNVEENFRLNYDIDDVLSNDFQAVISRVYYVHNRYNDRFFIDAG